MSPKSTFEVHDQFTLNKEIELNRDLPTDKRRLYKQINFSLSRRSVFDTAFIMY